MLYEDFSETVAQVLHNAIIQAKLEFTTPQIQSRAKSEASLRGKLIARNILESSAIESEIKDLGGARLVFYTNGDLTAFLNSGLLNENFNIDYDSSRIHHPVSGDDPNRQYRGFNYVVSLKEDRARLPEYARFAGLRCEVQLQTILNHAWSETSHDIAYKRPSWAGSSKRTLDAIDARLTGIMNKYLVPAGHEFQKVKRDFDSLIAGRSIFEQGPLKAIKACRDNNELQDVLERIQDNFLPHHDDPRPLVPELIETVSYAIETSRGTPASPIQTTFGTTDGFTGEMVVDSAMGLLDDIRYADPEATLDLLCKFFKATESKSETDRILTSVGRLTAYSISVFRQAGAEIQLRLVRRLSQLPLSELAVLRPIVLRVCHDVLHPEMTDTSGSYHAVTFSRASTPPSKTLKLARSESVDLLVSLYDVSTTDKDQLQLIATLSTAASTPIQSNYSDALLTDILDSAAKVLEFFTLKVPASTFEVKKSLEVHAWRMLRTLKTAQLENDSDGTFKILQQKLVTLASEIRDRLSADDEYVVFKTFVSLDSVYPPAWDDLNYDYRRDQTWREQKCDEFLSCLTTESADAWWNRIVRCASSASNDGAAFIGLQYFLTQLSEKHPKVVLDRLDGLEDPVAVFLPTILPELWRSSLSNELKPKLLKWAKAGRYLVSVARLYRFVKTADLTTMTQVTSTAEAKDDRRALMEVIETLTDLYDSTNVDGRTLLIRALNYLTSKGDTDWLDHVWYQQGALTSFVGGLSATEIEFLLKPMIRRPKLDYHLEQVLVAAAKVNKAIVIAFLGDRIALANDPECPKHYDAIPYVMTELSEILAREPQPVVDATLSWSKANTQLLWGDVGSLVHAIFPDITEVLAKALSDVFSTGDEENVPFSIAVLRAYDGAEAALELCKEIAAVLPEGDEKLNDLDIALNGTGTVSGEFGFVEAYQSKKRVVELWLNDSRPNVVAFAKRCLHGLELRIASEQNRAEQRQALDKLNWGEPL